MSGATPQEILDQLLAQLNEIGNEEPPPINVSPGSGQFIFHSNSDHTLQLGGIPTTLSVWSPTYVTSANTIAHSYASTDDMDMALESYRKIRSNKRPFVAMLDGEALRQGLEASWAEFNSRIEEKCGGCGIGLGEHRPGRAFNKYSPIGSFRAARNIWCPVPRMYTIYEGTYDEVRTPIADAVVCGDCMNSGDENQELQNFIAETEQAAQRAWTRRIRENANEPWESWVDCSFVEDLTCLLCGRKSMEVVTD